MSKQIYASDRETGLYLALTEEKKLLEYDVVSKLADHCPGTVINGSIQEVLPSLSAAFVNIGPYKQAFLPLDGRSLSKYKTGMDIPVQIKKAPVDEKGASVSDKIEILGNYLILIGNDDSYGISSKISNSAERVRLRNFVASFSINKTYCFIARTSAAYVSEEELTDEAEKLKRKYEAIYKNSSLLPVGSILFVPQPPFVEWFVRFDVEKIVFDNLEDKLRFMQTYPQWAEKASLYKDGHMAMEDFYKISSQLTKALKPLLYLEGSGSIVIEETTALCSVDVNSGKGDQRVKEEQCFSTNLKAANLICEQLRLRNIGGIIMVDFINMTEESHRQAVIDFIKQKSQEDFAQIKVFGFTQLGLLEMSRERKGLSLKRKLISH